MTCLLHNEENDHMVEMLAKQLSTECGLLNESLLEANKRIAYHMLCCNNGYAMHLDPNKNKSELYEYLLNNVCHGDKKAAILMKSYIYTKLYAAKHGDWLSQPDAKEPTYADILSDVEKGEIVLLFPHTDIDKVELFLYNSLTNSIIAANDATVGAFGTTVSIFSEERNAYVLSRLNSQEIIDEIETKVLNLLLNDPSQNEQELRDVIKSQYIYDFRTEYNKKTIIKLVEKVKATLADAWGIKFDENGKAINSIKEETYKNKKWWGRLNSGLDPYWILQYRCGLLDLLVARVENPYQTEIVLRIVQSALRNDNATEINMRMIDAYFDMFKDSPIIANGLLLSGLINKDEVTKKDIADVIGKFKSELRREMYEYTDDNSKNPIILAAKNILNGIKDALLLCFMFVSNLEANVAHSIPSVIAGVTVSAFVFNNPLAAIGSFLLAPPISKITNTALVNLYGSQYKKYLRYHEALRHIILAHALQLDMTSAFESDTEKSELLLELLNDSRGDSILIMLYKLRENMIKQLKSLAATAEYGKNKTNQEHKLKELVDLCNSALKSEESNRRKDVVYFVTDYCITAEQAISSVNDKLQYWSTHVDEIDIHELMRFKTEVIGAYYKSINCGLLPATRLRYDNGFYGQELVNIIQNKIASKINQTRNLFGEVLNKYLERYIDSVLQETAEKSVGKKKTKVLKDNIIHWMKNEINCGNISILSQYISPARTNTSPLVRLITQKLEEIDQNTTAEVERVAADLEALRVANRGLRSKWSWFNTLNKYCERDENGLFTGNFKSPVNYGQYMSDLHKERLFLLKKHKIATGKDGTVLWDNVDEETWKKYNIDLILWMAGADRDANGNYAEVDEHNNYLKDKNGNIILRGSKFNSDGTVDLKQKPFEPRIHRRYTYQYYIDKTEILGKRGCDVLSNINSQIAEINKKCMETFKIDGKTVRIPIPAKLNKDLRDRLQSATMRKSLLSSIYRVEDDDRDHRYIVALKKKSGEELEMAERFFLWNQKKRDYYETSKTTKNATYDFIVNQYESKIEELNLKIKDGDVSLVKNRDDLQSEYKTFVADSTKYLFSDEFMGLFGEQRKIKYDLSDPNVREYFSIRAVFAMISKKIASTNSKRTPDLSRIGNPETQSDEPDSIKSMWKQLTMLDQRLSELKKKLNISEQEDVENDKKLKRSDYISSVLVPKLVNDEESLYTFARWLINNTDVSIDDIQYQYGLKTRYCRLLKRYEADASKVLGIAEIVEEDGKRVMRRKYSRVEDVYSISPTGIFSNNKSILLDEEFDESDQNYVLVNKNYKRYDNQAQYDEIKDDPVYIEMLKLMDKAMENYAGFTRRNRYMLPQREASHTSMFGRGFLLFGHSFIKVTTNEITEAFKDVYTFNTRDDYADDVITRADGTTVELIPSRWLSLLENPNRIDTDLISSVIDFYTESVRYKYRSRIAPVMEAMYFQMCGGYDITSDAASRHQAEVIRGEINKTVYGRTVTGTGEGGRLTQDDLKFAKASKMFRSVLHNRLMKHNWRSVIKNALDSFFNVLQLTFMGKYILTLNITKAVGRMIYDPQNNIISIATQLGGIKRSKATNMTLALMHLNNIGNSIHERYKNLNQYWIRRFLGMIPTIEFEGIDYTTKAIITEAVYDTYRLIKNPSTGEYQFMNEAEAELAYLANGYTRQEGYDVWNNERVTLRDAYEFNKDLGLAELKKTIEKDGVSINVLDLVRPHSNVSISDDQRSRTLETKIKTTIRQLSSVANGMLENADRNTMARNYMGAIILAFRGWMVTQSGEYYKDGKDFYDYSGDVDTGKGLKKYLNSVTSAMTLSLLRIGGLDDLEYDGMYNFATGTIDKGLHKSLFKTLFSHFGQFLLSYSIIAEYLPNTRKRYAKNKITMNEVYQLRNFAAALHMFSLVVLLTTLALSWYSGDDGDDKYKKGMKSLVYSSLLASISERFTQLGATSFLLSSSDIIKAVSVGTVLIDDAHYIIDAANDLIDLAKGQFENDDIENDVDLNNWNTKLLTGSFQGKSKAQRDITRAAALTGVELLPYLFAMDYIMPVYDEDGNRESWTDYDLNYFKSKTEKGNLAAAKFYGTIVPTEWVANFVNNKFPDHPLTIHGKQDKPKIQKQKKSSKDPYAKKYSKRY